MKTETNNGRRWHVLLIACAMLVAASGAFAQGRYDNRYSGEHQHIDTRFDHNHYYFDRGYAVRAQPITGYAIDHGASRYWYDRGVWYRRGRANWVVVGAPIGAFITVLPPFYSTVWFGGIPYYYANDTYYTWSGGRNAYEVVDPPNGIDASGTTQAPTNDSIYVYPKNGQTPEQESRDRYECHRSAADRTGYDPTQSGGGVSSEVAATKRADYMRAETACLDARGYSVR